MRSEGSLNEELCESLRRKCRENAWLKAAADGDANDDSHGCLALELHHAASLEEVKSFLSAGAHSVGDAVILDDIAFIQQVDDGDEWWVLKVDEDGAWRPLDSISIRPMIEFHALDAYLASLRTRQRAALEEMTLSERSMAAKAQAVAPVYSHSLCDRVPGR